MKIFLLICGLAAVASARSINGKNDDENIAPLRRETFVTKLDHFAPQDGKTVKFNYTINPRHFEVEDAPVFINIAGGELDDITWLYDGLSHEIAKEVNAAVIQFNARYFGNNLQLTPDLSYDNLKYLTVEQSLADIAALIIHIREEYNASHSRFILTGAGYGGTLAALARQKYPHLVYGVWSSSGLFERHVYSKEQFEQVSHLIREHGGSDCADHVELAFQEIEDHLIQFDIYYIEEIFDLCIYVMPYFEDEMAMFFSGLANYIIDFINANHIQGVKDFCDAIEASEIGAPKHLNFANWVTTHYGYGECLDYDYTSRIEKLLNTSLASPTVQSGELQRLYLECTQLGTHPISVNGDTLFGRWVAQDYYYYLCGDVFGQRFDYQQLKQSVKDYNNHYGGKLPHITNAVFSNGLLDSDYAFGITEDEEEWDAYVINIAEVGKSADFMKNSESDTASLVLAKYSIEQLLVEWVKRD